MKNLNNNIRPFLELVRAGLWETSASFLSNKEIDFNAIYRLAQEQSVVGLVAAGVEHLADIKIPKEQALLFAGDTLQLEQRNNAMNCFLGNLVDKMRKYGVYCILLKGQGISQCYERPLWRASGDIDLFLSKDSYILAKSLLSQQASKTEEEYLHTKHLAFTIDSWEVEIHGSLRGGLLGRIDKMLDDVQAKVFYEGKVRSWINGNTQIFLLNVDEEIVYLFTHILEHFFKGGVGLRQLCDWCRALWVFKEKIDTSLLKKRLNDAGIMSEWRAFAALAVDSLGIPVEAMPLYSPDLKWKLKGKRILSFVLETGNMGHNRDLSYYDENSFWSQKLISLWSHTYDSIRYLFIFPIDALLLWAKMFSSGIKAILKIKLPKSIK